MFALERTACRKIQTNISFPVRTSRTGVYRSQQSSQCAGLCQVHKSAISSSSMSDH